jgi:hypothetical protein
MPAKKVDEAKEAEKAAKKAQKEAKEAEKKAMEELKQKFVDAVKSGSTMATGAAANAIDNYNHSGRGQIKFSKSEITPLLAITRQGKNSDLFKNRLTGDTRYIFITPSRGRGRTLRNTRGGRKITRKNGF